MVKISVDQSTVLGIFALEGQPANHPIEYRSHPASTPLIMVQHQPPMLGILDRNTIQSPLKPECTLSTSLQLSFCSEQATEEPKEHR